MTDWRDQFKKIEPYYDKNDGLLFLGDCIDILKGVEAGSVDCIVTDPPY